MINIPAPTLVLPREEWPDADFDLPEGEPIHALSDKEDEDEEEDWDIEMDLGKTGGVKARAIVASMAARTQPSFSNSQSQIFNIRPPLPPSDVDDDNEEGASTIKAAASTITATTYHKPIPAPAAPLPSSEDDFEDAFALPSDLTQLSLAPLSLHHRSSKHSLEWGDKDHTSSSQSSDAYSSLGFADASPSSNSVSSVSLPCTESEDDEEDEDELEGLVIPPSLFESGRAANHLTKVLEMKKKAQSTTDQHKVAPPDPEEDFEMGLVIDDDVDLSPSRLLGNSQQQLQRSFNRSNSLPPNRSTARRPPSRISRAKSPLNPPPSSVRQLQKIRLSPSPPHQQSTSSQALQSLAPASPSPLSSKSLLVPKPGSLRGQKSYSGLKPPTPPSTLRKLSRKASLSSLIEASQSQASGSAPKASTGVSKGARYEEPTAASRAKVHKNTTGRISEFKVPPTRPSTPSANPAALRLTMPTQSRFKTRPALSSVFGAAPIVPLQPQPTTTRAISPLPPRPPSTLSMRSSRATPPIQSSGPKMLRRPKRQRTYGDGTELDGIEDLPLDREKESRFRVQPKGYGNRIPGATYQQKAIEKGTVRRKSKNEGISGTNISNIASQPVHLLRRTTRIESFLQTPASKDTPLLKKKKKTGSPATQTKRKPTLIRNLGGNSAPKVIGDMKWNPHTLRWEGNDHILRDFDAVVGTSTRPALITHLTGSSIGSPVSSFASGARRVGNMIFDPTRMCWISTLPPEEDEPDVFANLADDEESEGWEEKGGTLRANAQLSATGNVTSESSLCSPIDAPSPGSHTRTISESGSDRGSRASMVFDIDEDFIASCRLAEERHHVEMKGWKPLLSRQEMLFSPDYSSLYEIRALATRKY